MVKRNFLMEDHFGEDYFEMINYPEEREWYGQNIFPIDCELIYLGNKILKEELGRSEVAPKIQDIYENEALMNYYNKTIRDISKNKEIEK